MRVTDKMLKALRNKDISQTEVAHRVGISKQSMNDFATGHRFPTRKWAEQISQVLEVPVEALFDGIAPGEPGKPGRKPRP